MFNWKELEDALTLEATLGIDRWIRRNPDKQAFAAAFHECYSELDGVITIPQLAINAVDKTMKDNETADGGSKWNSADWPWLEIFPSRTRLAKWESQLTKEACKGSEEHWRKTEKRFHSVLVRVVKALYRHLAKSSHVTPDFVVYIDHESEDLELIRRCVPARLFQKHFSEFEKEKPPKTSSQDARIKLLFSDLFGNEKEIIALGKNAVAALVEALDDPNDGWCAAGLLGDIGIASSLVIDALRHRVVNGKGSTPSHAALALGLLGDLDFLLDAAKVKATQEAAVGGVMIRLKDRASGRGIRLDYRPAEQLLAMKSKKVSDAVAEEIEPGRPPLQIEVADVDEALRGLSLEHRALRQHALMILGNRKLGAKAGTKILPAVAECLKDSNATTRRLALIALSNWKLAAASWFPAMRALMKDEDSLVRQYARNIMDQFKGRG